MGYNAGDKATLKLTVTPSDGTTAVTMTLTAPDGTTSTPVVTGGPADWQSIVTLTLAGLYVATWSVTGTGFGSEQHRVVVAPNGPIATGHATSTDLANWLQAAPPSDADRQLARATQRVNATVVAYYPRTEVGVPTDPEVVVALRDATCAQVEHWLSVGEDNDIDGYPEDTGIGANGVGVSKRPLKLAPRARQLLRDAGLLQARSW